MSKFDYQKELKESIFFGFVIGAPLKAGVDYLRGKKITMTSFAEIGAIGTVADVIYDYGKQQKWWFWL